MRRLNVTVLCACGLLMSSCAALRQPLGAVPRVEMPAEADRSCSIYLLPPKPTQADLEIGYATRGAELVACDAARRLAVETHASEHALEDLARRPPR